MKNNKAYILIGILLIIFLIGLKYRRKGPVFPPETVYTSTGWTNPNEIEKYKNIADSIQKERYKTGYTSDSGKLFPDSMYIDTFFLNNNLNLSFLALTESPWADSVNANDFIEYILPYKLSYEKPDNWRDTLYRKNRELIKEHPEWNSIDSLWAYHMRTTYNELVREEEGTEYPKFCNYTWIEKNKKGDCSKRCQYMIYHLRAAGVPATYDYLVAWGNKKFNGHAYVGIAGRKKQIKHLLKNNNDSALLVNDLNACTNKRKIRNLSIKDLPEGWYVEYEKTIPKIYRQTSSINPEILKQVAKAKKHEIVSTLVKPNMKDVTDQYLEAGEVEIKKPVLNFSNLAYLCVFSRGGWVPVAFAAFKGGKAIFNKMGENVVYMPMVKRKSGLKPIGLPFYLNKERNKVEFKKKNNYEQVVLTRKYPLFAYSMTSAIDFNGLRIVGIMDKKKKTVLIDSIENNIYRPLDLKVDIKDSIRKIKLYSLEKNKLHIAEIECYCDENGKEKKVEDVAYKAGKLKKRMTLSFDGKYGTYRIGRNIGVDFGRKVKLSRIRIAPKSDTNFIIEGNEYELFYWNGKWVSLGRKTATSLELKYDKVPKGALLWLKCLTEGKEERIFTYENGRQIWW